MKKQIPARKKTSQPLREQLHNQTCRNMSDQDLASVVGGTNPGLGPSPRPEPEPQPW
jgi:hypothetical protein